MSLQPGSSDVSTSSSHSPDASSFLSIDQMVCVSAGRKRSLRLLRSSDLVHVSDFRLPSVPYRLLTLSCDSLTSLVVAVSFHGYVGVYDIGRRRVGKFDQEDVFEEALAIPRSTPIEFSEREDLGNVEDAIKPERHHHTRVFALEKKILGGSIDDMLILSAEDQRNGNLIVWKPDFSGRRVLDPVWKVESMPPNMRAIVSGFGVFGDEIVYAGGGRGTGSGEGYELMRFDLEKMKRLDPLLDSSMGHIEGISLVEETSQIVVASYNGSVFIFDPRSQKHVGHFRAGSYCYSIRKFMEARPARIVLGMYSGRLRIYDPRLLLPAPDLACEEVPAHARCGQIWNLASLSDSIVLSGSTTQSVAKSCVRTGKLLARAELDQNSEKFGCIDGICTGYDAGGWMGLGARMREEIEERWSWGWSFVLRLEIGVVRVLVADSIECVKSFLIIME